MTRKKSNNSIRPEKDSLPDVTPEAARVAISRNISNLLKKVESGKTLNAAEREIILSIANGEDSGEFRIWAEDYSELSEILEISPDRLKGMRQQGAPRPASNGRLHIPNWRRWIFENGATYDLPEQSDRPNLADFSNAEKEVFEVQRLILALGDVSESVARFERSIALSRVSKTDLEILKVVVEKIRDSGGDLTADHALEVGALAKESGFPVNSPEAIANWRDSVMQRFERRFKQYLIAFHRHGMPKTTDDAASGPT